MLFNSYAFFIFFIIVAVVYWRIKDHNWKIYFLAIASFVFYAYSYIPNIFVLLYSIFINYYCAVRINDSTSPKAKKGFLLLSVFGNLSILIFFKYINFLMDIAHDVLPVFNINTPPLFLKFALPLGISFFTFQGMAYSIDVYRGKVNAERSLIRFAFFKNFFSQLIAGPILRAEDFLPQLVQKKIFDKKNLEMGFYLILWGLIKKVIIADNIAPIANEFFSKPNENIFSAWIAIYAFSFQIYCDFSGYCDIALGSAKILGYKIPLNFEQPYLSGNVTVFWRRWHITLSNWFRDYFYIPLGGSRGGEARFYFNLILTMLVVGLWHGANYTFLIWGLFHGVLLALHKVYKKFVPYNIPKVIGVIITFHFVCIGWIFFRAQTIELAWHVLSSAFNFTDLRIIDMSVVIHLMFFTIPLLLLQIAERRFSIKQNFLDFPFIIKVGFVITAILSIVSFGVMGNEFIYFEF